MSATRTESPEATERLGEALASAVQTGDVILLEGPLGAGKTRFVMGLARGLACKARVRSPTFGLVHEYHGRLILAHLDLYRLANETELENLGLRDWLEEPATWVLVEWPERAPHLEARCDLLLEIADVGANARRIVIRGETSAGIAALREIGQVRFNNRR